MTVLVGTTLRPEDAPLVELAALLASRLEMPLRLVHVCEDFRAPLVLGTDQEYLLGAVREDLGRQAEDLQRVSGATVQPHLAAGSVVNALVSLAQFELATVLVVGPTTRRLRNTAERVARGSRVPVLVARAPERLTAWLRDGEPLRLVVGADFTETDHRVICHAIGHAAEGATVHIAHVLDQYDSPSELRQAREDARYHLSRLERDVAVERSIAVDMHVLEGAPSEQLLALSERVGADLLVLGARKRTAIGRVLMGSLARAIIGDSRFPVLVVPARSP